MRRRAALVAVLVLALLGCGPEVPAPPDPETAAMEPGVGRAIAEARAAVLAQPRSAEAWGELGMVLHAHELFSDAATCYRTAAHLAPDDERWPYFLGVVLSVEAEDVDSALAAYRRTLELRPRYAPAHLRLGDLLAAAERLDEAEAAYRRALELAPDLAPAELGLGRTLLRHGRAEDAVDHLERAAAALPESGAALDALGRAYVQVGRVEEARAVAARARAPRGFDTFADPLMREVVARQVSTTLLWPRARQALAAGRSRQALALLQRIERQQPSDPEVHERLGFAFLDEDQPGRAVDELRRALELDPQRRAARAQLGLLLLDAGQAAAAVEELRRALATEPEEGEGEDGAGDDAALRAHLGRALTAAGRSGEAVEVFAGAAAAAATAGEPLPAWAEHAWGLALADRERFAAAVEHFRAALRDEPDNAEGQFHLGLALEALGRRDEAIAAYRRAAELEPNQLIASRLEALGARP